VAGGIPGGYAMPPGYAQAGGYMPPGGYPPTFVAPAQTSMYGDYPLAGWGERLGAALLDGVILAPIYVAAQLLATASDVAGLIAYAVYFIAVLLYAPLLMARQGAHNGQTIGKQVVNIRVLREDLQAMTFGRAVLREFLVKALLFGVLGIFTLYILTLLDYLWPLWDQGRQALHDKVASTRVVKA
jgi:uncharacterized RDD family membrane protein YckC